MKIQLSDRAIDVCIPLPQGKVEASVFETGRGSTKLTSVTYSKGGPAMGARLVLWERS